MDAASLGGYLLMVARVRSSPPCDERHLLIGSSAESVETYDIISKINGKLVSDLSRQAIVANIHEGIRSRTLALQIKKRSANGSSVDLQAFDVCDAYVIASDNSSRERLVQLPALQSVMPVDMKVIYDIDSRHENIISRNRSEDNITRDYENIPMTLIPASVAGRGGKQNGHTNASYGLGMAAMEPASGSMSVSALLHREMAVDVPADFLPAPKVHPRLPDSVQSNSVQGLSLSLDKMRKYEDEVKKHKDHELRLHRQNELLHHSLRDSKKLQALQETRRQQTQQQSKQTATEDLQQHLHEDSFINTGFLVDEEKGSKPKLVAAVKYSQSSTSLIQKEISEAENVTIIATSRSSSSALGDFGVEQLLVLLQALRSKLGGTNSNELRFLNQLFNNVKFQDALGLHNGVARARAPLASQSGVGQGHAGRVLAVSDGTATEVAANVYNSLLTEDASADCRALAAVLKQPKFKCLLAAHDVLAAAQKSPILAAVTADDDEVFEKVSEYSGESIKIVRILKSSDPLGATVRNEGDAVVIGRVVQGGAAAKSGALHEGDELLEVNNIRMRGKNVNEVSDILAKMSGPLSFIVVPCSREPGTSSKISASDLVRSTDVVHMRALFDYNPEDDAYLPCQELGISFHKGDVLHVISQADASWWQAYRDGEDDNQALAGLIPSKSFQDMRESMRLCNLVGTQREAAAVRAQQTCCTAMGAGKRRGRKYKTDAGEVDEALTYEEVLRYYPQANRKRPVILVGPPDVGRKELRELLMQRFGDGRFATAIPHTSRPRKSHEVDGKDYHFVPCHIFEADIRANKFVEHGQFEGHYYGTTLDAIRKVCLSGETCVLNLHPVSLKILRHSGLMPYVVYVAPPHREKLKQNLLQHSGCTSVSNEELNSIMEKGQQMETKYGHLFDMVLVNEDYRRAVDELVAHLNRIDIEPQWVPCTWLQQPGATSFVVNGNGAARC